MRFAHKSDSGGRSISLTATPGEYDAIPTIGAARIDAVPLNLHPDRAAVAYCLLYAGSVSGNFELPDNGCSPNVAAAISSFFEPGSIHVFPVNLTPSRITIGDAEVEVDMHGTGDARKRMPGRIFLSVVDEGVGGLATMEGMVVSSNASLLADASGTPLERALPILGVTTLFCEDLLCGSIVLPESLLSAMDRTLVRKIRRLLDSVGLRISAA